MKTAVSVPDDLFDEADELAARLHTSRSRVFSDALREYLDRHSPERATEVMNADDGIPHLGGGPRFILQDGNPRELTCYWKFFKISEKLVGEKDFKNSKRQLIDKRKKI